MILVSIMRNAEGYLDRFNDQVAQLKPRKVIVAEGDSTDQTYKALLKTDYEVLKVEHGGPYYPSLDIPMRWRQMGAVCEVALTAAVRELQADEALLYVESDLVWEPESMRRLLEHVTMYPAVAPMSMYEDRFYDEWGYTHNWQKFHRHSPYFDGWSDNMMHEITSAGSCTAFSWTAAQFAHFSPVDCIRGIGRTLKEAGFSLWLDPTLEVRHL